MKWTPRVFLACLILSSGLLSLSFGLGGLWQAIPVLLAIAGLWGWASRRAMHWATPLCFLLLLGASATGMGLVPTHGVILVGMAASLAAWDLDHFLHRTHGVKRIDEAAALERSHLLRLGAVLAVGALLAAAALLLRLNFSFGIFFLIGLLAIIGLSRAIIFLKRTWR